MASMILVFPSSSKNENPAPAPVPAQTPVNVVAAMPAVPAAPEPPKSLPHPVAIPGPLALPANPPQPAAPAPPPTDSSRIVYTIQTPPQPAPQPAPTPVQAYKLVTAQPVQPASSLNMTTYRPDEPIYWWLGQEVPAEPTPGKGGDQSMEYNGQIMPTSLTAPTYWWVAQKPAN